MTSTVRLTTAQALVRWMLAQRSELLDGTEVPLFPGVFAIFGHGNVLGLGTALHDVRDQLPTWRGQNEQGMALAAVAYARATDRRQVMVATTSVGPGALNMVTAAGLAHANRLPVLLLPGDTFTSRAPDPVLQQVEHFGDPTISVNDAFRPVARYFDRITRPEQLVSSLPHVARVLTDPADCGPVVLALPQDVQAEQFDYPVAMFEPHLHRVPRQRPDTAALDEVVGALRAAQRPLLVLGGGVRYSGAGAEALALAERHHVPVVETVAGRTLVPHEHPLFGGALGIIGSSSANTLAKQADVVVAVGTRLQDFTTSSWTGFDPSVRMITVNAARFDAVKHGALALVGDARACLTEIDDALDDWSAPAAWAASVPTLKGTWDEHVDTLRAGDGGEGSVLTYAQVTGVVNEASTPEDYVLTASGGMPGELHGGWRTGEVKHGSGATSGATMDLEYGFSCMGYEVVAPWGAAMARELTHPGGLVTSIFGDGSYLMLNSEIYSAAFSGHPYVAVVCDNGGFAVIHRLQTNQGAEGFNNLLSDSRGPGADGSVRVDFAAHAASMGAHVEDVRDSTDLDELRAAYARAREAARAQRRPAVVVCTVQQSSWTEAGAWWETGTPESLSGRAAYDEGKADQLRWLR